MEVRKSWGWYGQGRIAMREKRMAFLYCASTGYRTKLVAEKRELYGSS
ncbi:MAG: hypothetical protein K2N63_04650 [Lachnospiraceae bacterium]|nr:hypothetical protein [Lachnospiraceae bacterium]